MIVTKINNRIRSSWTQAEARQGSEGCRYRSSENWDDVARLLPQAVLGFKHQTYDMDLALKVKRNQIEERST